LPYHILVFATVQGPILLPEPAVKVPLTSALDNTALLAYNIPFTDTPKLLPANRTILFLFILFIVAVFFAPR
jgi:hypothetical protein